MKKMLSTLTAIVLSVAVVSTVEAKRVGGSTTPATVDKEIKRGEAESKKGISSTASESVTIRSVNRKVAEIQKIEQDLMNLRSWRRDLVSGYSEEDRLKAEQMVDGLAVQRAQARADIKKLENDQAAYVKKGWLGYFGTKITDEAKYNEIETQIKELKAQVAAADAAIQQQKIILGDKYCDTIVRGFETIVAIYVSMKLDQIFNNSKMTNFGIQKISDAYNKVASYAPEFVTTGYGWAKGKAMAASSAVYTAGASAAGTAREYGAPVVNKAYNVGAAGIDYGRRAGQAVGLGNYVGMTAEQRDEAARAAGENMERNMPAYQ